MKKFILICVSIVLLMLPGCNSMPDQIDKIIIENEKIEVAVGETIKLDIKYEPKNAIANELIMSSNNEQIAIINGMGEVIGKNVGETEIRISAKRGNVFTTKKVKVVENLIKNN